MLILTRRVGEALVVGEGATQATVRVLGIRGNQARIGIETAKNISVHREEIYQRIQQEKADGISRPEPKDKAA